MCYNSWIWIESDSKLFIINQSDFPMLPPNDQSDDPDFDTPTSKKRKTASGRSSTSSAKSRSSTTSSKRKSPGGSIDVLKGNVVRKLQQNVEYYYRLVTDLKDDNRIKDRQIEYYRLKLAFINEISTIGISSVERPPPDHKKWMSKLNIIRHCMHT